MAKKPDKTPPEQQDTPLDYQNQPAKHVGVSGITPTDTANAQGANADTSESDEFQRETEAVFNTTPTNATPGSGNAQGQGAPQPAANTYGTQNDITDVANAGIDDADAQQARDRGIDVGGMSNETGANAEPSQGEGGFGQA